jgi:hypothetical protein
VVAGKGEVVSCHQNLVQCCGDRAKARWLVDLTCVPLSILSHCPYSPSVHRAAYCTSPLRAPRHCRRVYVYVPWSAVHNVFVVVACMCTPSFLTSSSSLESAPCHSLRAPCRRSVRVYTRARCVCPPLCSMCTPHPGAHAFSFITCIRPRHRLHAPSAVCAYHVCLVTPVPHSAFESQNDRVGCAMERQAEGKAGQEWGCTPGYRPALVVLNRISERKGHPSPGTRDVVDSLAVDSLGGVRGFRVGTAALVSGLRSFGGLEDGV